MSKGSYQFDDPESAVEVGDLSEPTVSTSWMRIRSVGSITLLLVIACGALLVGFKSGATFLSLEKKSEFAISSQFNGRLHYFLLL
jgi:hypothetical protein